MTHKTISLSEKAYNLLKKVKREGESFSKVIERLIEFILIFKIKSYFYLFNIF